MLLDLFDQKADDIAAYAAEDADVTWQIAGLFTALARGEVRNGYFAIEDAGSCRCSSTLEFEGIAIDVAALGSSADLARRMSRLTGLIETDAGRPFNLNSPAQLGQILFDELCLIDKPKKTKTGQHRNGRNHLADVDWPAPNRRTHSELPAGGETEEHVCRRPSAGGESHDGPVPHASSTN